MGQRLDTGSGKVPGGGLTYIPINFNIIHKMSQSNIQIAFLLYCLPVMISCGGSSGTKEASTDYSDEVMNQKAEGYNGIWYQNTPLENEFRFKYSGGLGTYCAKHRPFALYAGR